MFRSRILLTAAGVLAASAVAASGAHAAAPGASSLYLQQATSGALHGDTLVLRGVSPRTTQFADRPARSAGSLSTGSFIGDWRDAFGDDPPNAALEVADAPASRDVALLELRSPRYDARTRTLTYRVRHLRTSGAKSLHALAARADRGVRDFGRATLFIDDGSTETALFFQATIPAGATISVTPSNFTFDFNQPLTGNGQMIAAINPTQLMDAELSAFYGASLLNIEYQAGVQNSVTVQMSAGIVAPGQTTLTGTASVPAGASLTVTPGNVTITDGSFSIPVP
jgi:hypothetical protein